MPNIKLNRKELLKHIRAHRKYGSTERISICAYSGMVFFRTYKDNVLSLSTTFAKPYFVQSYFYNMAWKDFVNAVMETIGKDVLIRQVDNRITVGNVTFDALDVEQHGEGHVLDRVFPLRTLAQILKPAKMAKGMSKASALISGQDGCYVSRIGDKKQIVVSYAFAKSTEAYVKRFKYLMSYDDAARLRWLCNQHHKRDKHVRVLVDEDSYIFEIGADSIRGAMIQEQDDATSHIGRKRFSKPLCHISASRKDLLELIKDAVNVNAVRVSAAGIMVGYWDPTSGKIKTQWEDVPSMSAVVDIESKTPVTLCPVRVKEALRGIGTQDHFNIVVMQDLVAFIGDTATHYIALHCNNEGKRNENIEPDTAHSNTGTDARWRD